MAKTVKIIKKALGTFYSHLQALTNCKVSEKSNERFPRKSMAHIRMDERTDGRTNGHTRLLRSQRPVGRETKKWGSQTFSTGHQLSEYVQVVCRNTN